MGNQESITIKEVLEYSGETLEAVKKLVTQLDTHFQPLTELDLRMIISSDTTHLFLAYHKYTNQITGMITLITYRIPYKMKGWIEDVVVDEAYRRHGIGEALMHHAITEAKKYGVHSLNLTSNPKREAANQIYIRLGFEKRDTNVYRMNLN